MGLIQVACACMSPRPGCGVLHICLLSSPESSERKAPREDLFRHLPRGFCVIKIQSHLSIHLVRPRVSTAYPRGRTTSAPRSRAKLARSPRYYLYGPSCSIELRCIFWNRSTGLPKTSAAAVQVRNYISTLIDCAKSYPNATWQPWTHEGTAALNLNQLF